MTLRHYLLTLSSATAVAWCAVGTMIAFTDPAVIPPVVLAAFYACLWLALSGTFSVIGFLLRISLLKKSFLLSHQVAVSFRQAIMLAALIIIALILKSRGLLDLPVAILMVTAMTLFEFFFLTSKRPSYNKEK